VSQNSLDILSAATLTRARRLIRDESAARGINLPEARRIVAGEAGLMPGTLENLERGRIKNIERIARSLDELLEKKIERRIATLQHELELCRAARSVAPADLDRAEAALAEARRALGKA
jgi:hypothetical protein